jgi:CheY-like chemotaxis protein
LTHNLDRAFAVNAHSRACAFWLCAPNTSDKGGSTKRVDTPPERPYRILVVDDEDGFRRSLAFKLRRLHSAVVEEAASGSAALEILEDHSEEEGFNLILMDLSMPGMTGMEAYREIRRRGVDTPVILMSAYSTPENEEEAQTLGVTLLAKPIDKETLRKTLLFTFGGTQVS